VEGKIRIARIIRAGSLAAGLAAGFLAACSVQGDTSQMAAPGGSKQAFNEPGGDPASAAKALSTPDEFAWSLFEFLCLQAAPGPAGVAAGRPITSYDDDMPVVFETWALASGTGANQAGSEVFKPDGSDPGPWTALPRGGAAQKLFSAQPKLAPGAGPQLQTRSDALAPSIPGSGGRIATPTSNEEFLGFEVRMNQPAFDFVRSRTMYNIEGLEALFQQAVASGNRDLIQFPAAAKEIKADWVPTTNPTSISDDEKLRYHWRKVGDRYFKLVALHISTKDLNNWFWADFAQEDYETSQGPGAPVIANPSIDSTTRGPSAPDRGDVDGVRKELMGSKWAHYRLRGSQVDFNMPTVVGNPMIEGVNARASSCMTCHFRATIGPVPNGQILTLGSVFVTGTPSPSLLGQGSDVVFLATDFEWSAPRRAQHLAVH
jgi:hypothetical protein